MSLCTSSSFGATNDSSKWKEWDGGYCPAWDTNDSTWGVDNYRKFNNRLTDWVTRYLEFIKSEGAKAKTNYNNTSGFKSNSSVDNNGEWGFQYMPDDELLNINNFMVQFKADLQQPKANIGQINILTTILGIVTGTISIVTGIIAVVLAVVVEPTGVTKILAKVAGVITVISASISVTNAGIAISGAVYNKDLNSLYGKVDSPYNLLDGEIKYRNMKNIHYNPNLLKKDSSKTNASNITNVTNVTNNTNISNDTIINDTNTTNITNTTNVSKNSSINNTNVLLQRKQVKDCQVKQLEPVAIGDIGNIHLKDVPPAYKPWMKWDPPRWNPPRTKWYKPWTYVQYACYCIAYTICYAAYSIAFGISQAAYAIYYVGLLIGNSAYDLGVGIGALKYAVKVGAFDGEIPII